MTLLGLSKQGVCWSALSPPSVPAAAHVTHSGTSRDDGTPYISSSPVTAATAPSQIPSQMPSQNQRPVLPPDVRQVLIHRHPLTCPTTPHHTTPHHTTPHHPTPHPLDRSRSMTAVLHHLRDPSIPHHLLTILLPITSIPLTYL